MVETPPLWHGVEIQLIAGFLGLLLMFGLAWLNGANRRRVDLLFMLTDAMRRMAKGDFNILLPEPGPMGDELGGLVQGFNEMAVELGQMEKLRQEFISNVSHEIQSPLTSIRGFSRALMDDRLDSQERKQYLSIIEAESERLSKISDNLLKLSSLESAQPPFEPQRYRLDKQLRNLVLACEPQWVAKELELDIQLEEGSIAADQDLLSQVWTNLLHNGIKFTPLGGTLGVRLTFAGPWARVEIRDTGIGIAEADQARIFERFYKADTARSSSGGGSGLGLSIAHKIVGLHGGSISVESWVGEGTIFTVLLPIEAALPPEAGEERPE
ncbi:HAMP domain-containing histidine kinase [Paenibacillus athensensis]|uniref:histidine kinase n=2 Tax=Paenibacillus athensensis TaxID=1967502 RepID=A0A4Y8Q9T7_9BACL|nr:HAMP domain-containing histidine kinase [Paenibacillus athensensis]